MTQGEHARTFNKHRGIAGLSAEIDALRAENERLLKFAHEQEEGWRQATFEIERLRADHAAADRQAEEWATAYEREHATNERLRAVVEAARQFRQAKIEIGRQGFPAWELERDAVAALYVALDLLSDL